MTGWRNIVARIWRREAGDPLADQAADGLFRQDAAAPVILVTAFGIAADGLDAALDRALAGQPEVRRVICLTDQPDFLPLRRRGVAFEYLPPSATRSAALADVRSWRAYISERYDILLAKWRPAQVIDAGASLEQFLG